MGWNRTTQTLAALALSGGICLDAHASERRDDESSPEWSVVRLETTDTDALAQLEANGARRLTERVVPGEAIVFLLPRHAELLPAALGLTATIRVHDVERRVSDERARLRSHGPAGHGAAFFDDFRDLEAIETHLDDIVARARIPAELEVIGTSVEGRPIRALTVGSTAQGAPSIFIAGTMHAREWISASTVTCLADRFARGADATPEGGPLDGVKLVIVPMVNPDGYAYSWDEDRYWRKNRREGGGVDINRNFPFEWGGVGSSADPRSDDYRGPSAASEPETRALTDYMSSDPDMVAFIDFHSFGQLIVYPWGHTTDPTDDHEAYETLAASQAAAIEAVDGSLYYPLQGSMLATFSGVGGDWAYGDAGLMAFGVELPPSIDDEDGDFVVDPALIRPACDQAYADVLALAAWAAQGEVDPPDEGSSSSSTGGNGDPGQGDSTGSNTPPSATSSGTAGSSESGAGQASTGSADTEPQPAGASSEIESDGCGCAQSPGGGPPLATVLTLFGLWRRQRVRPHRSSAV